MDKISILVVDDHPMMRMGVVALIGSCDDMTIVGQAATSEEALKLFQASRPQLILMDLRLPDRSGVETIHKIRSIDPNCSFIVLTTYEGDEDIHQALAAGAKGYLIKGMPSEMLLHAIRRVHAGGRFLPPPILRTLQSRTPNAELSARERQVLALLVAGRSNKQIASELYISEATVKCHVSVILMRLNVMDRTQAVVAALQRGLAHL